MQSLPSQPDRITKFLLAIIGIALMIIALRPFVAPIPAQAQSGNPLAAPAAMSGTSVVISDKMPSAGQTALISYKNFQGSPRLSVLVYKNDKWQYGYMVGLPD